MDEWCGGMLVPATAASRPAWHLLATPHAVHPEPFRSRASPIPCIALQLTLVCGLMLDVVYLAVLLILRIVWGRNGTEPSCKPPSSPAPPLWFCGWMPHSSSSNSCTVLPGGGMLGTWGGPTSPSQVPLPTLRPHTKAAALLTTMCSEQRRQVLHWEPPGQHFTVLFGRVYVHR